MLCGKTSIGRSGSLPRRLSKIDISGSSHSPVTRARCITDPLGKKNRAFIYRHGCAKIVADAQIIKKEFIEQYGIAPEKIEVIGSAVYVPEAATPSAKEAPISLEEFQRRRATEAFRAHVFSIAAEETTRLSRRKATPVRQKP